MEQLKNAVGYVRVSTEAQGQDDKYGIDVQKEAILEYAAEHGYSIQKWYVDEMSGAKDNRPGLNEILYGKDVTNPPFEAVIVFKNDRLARDTKLYFYYLYVLERDGITLLSTREEFTEGSEFTNIYRALLQFVAEQERKNIMLRTSRGRMSKARCGGYSGGRVPYGYKVENGTLVVDEEERKVVEFIFERAWDGAPQLIIAEELNAQGFKTRGGRCFYCSTVRSVLHNEEFYRGKYKYGDMPNYVPGLHEPILPIKD